MTTRERLKQEMMNHPSGLVQAGVKHFDSIPEWVEKVEDIPFLLISPDIDTLRMGLCTPIKEAPELLDSSFRRLLEEAVALTIKDCLETRTLKIFEECGSEFVKETFEDRLTTFILTQEFPKNPEENHWPSNIKNLDDVGKAFKEHWEGVEGVISSLKELVKYEDET